MTPFSVRLCANNRFAFAVSSASSFTASLAFGESDGRKKIRRLKPDTSENKKGGGQSQCFGRGGRVHSFGASCPLRFVHCPVGPTAARSPTLHCLSLSSQPNNSKPKWGSKPHLRSLWLHSISPLISDPPHKLLRERASGRASERAT